MSGIVSSLAQHDLKTQASKVQRFVAKITFELAEVQDLLLDLTEPNATFRTVACEWIQNNKERWDKWKPVETNCDPGFGMVDAQGSFVANRTGAVNCGLCPAGTASEEVLDDEGRTFQCKLCHARQGTASPTHFPPNVSHAPRATSVTTMAARSVQHVVWVNISPRKDRQHAFHAMHLVPPQSRVLRLWRIVSVLEGPLKIPMPSVWNAQ